MALVKSKQETKKYKSRLIAKNVIGTLGEKGLHSALKNWYAMPGDYLETEVDGFHIDIIRNNLFIEIQTTNFSSIKEKLNKLADTHSVRLVFPIAQEKWIVRLLLFLGADVLRLEYDYSNRPDFLKLTGAERVQWLVSDVTASCKVASTQRRYQKITLIGKSIGTLAMGHLLASDTMFDNTHAIWLTPLFRNERLRKQIQQCRQKSLFVIGTADPNYDPVFLTEVAAKGESLVIDGADHSLEIEGDPMQSLEAMDRLIKAIKKFRS